MISFRKIGDIWNKYQFILTKNQKRWAVFVLVMTVFGALFETMGVSAIIPFMQALVSPETLFANEYLLPLIQLFHIRTTGQLILLLGSGIALIYIAKNLFLVMLSYCRIKYSTKVQRELSVTLMRAYMKRGYLFFAQVNTSDLLRSIINDVASVYQMMYHAFRIAAELLTSFAIVLFIFITDVHMALCVVILALVCFLVVVVGFRSTMRRLGVEYRESNKEIHKHSLQAFQGIKEVLVMHRQRFFVKRYEGAFIRQQKALIGQTVASESPAFIIEAICVAGLIMTVSFRVNSGTDVNTFIPQLAAFAIGAFRILPSLGRIVSSVNQMIYHVPALDKTYENLKEVRACVGDQKGDIQELLADNSTDAVKCHEAVEEVDDKTPYLQIKDVHWQYPNMEKKVLQGVNICIEKGSSVAFIGQSGAGKTTLADIILGLYKPQQGDVYFKGQTVSEMNDSWSKLVGYIPQTVYLTDDTIRNNVAFGVEEPDEERIWMALEQAQLKDFVLGLPNKLDTIVGDRGVRFSGGQRQRVAIARALYENPEILILDEATSALDHETEMAVMEAIESLQGSKTLIIVAHRLTTIQNCDVIYEIADGKEKRREWSEIAKNNQ